MQLPGRLRATTLGDLLGSLFREGATGVLELLEASGHAHRVHMVSGEITFVEVDRAAPPLAEMLRREDLVPEDVLRRSLLRALSSRRLHGTVLVSEFQIAPAIVDSALRKQLTTRLHVLESVRDAQVLFRVAVRPKAMGLASGPLRAAEFLHGRARARDRGAWSGRAGGASASGYASASGGGSEEGKRARARRVLGLSGAEDLPTVKAAYRRLVREFHPDTHPDASDAECKDLSARFSEVTEAYRALVG
jgi:DnaJ domain